MSPTRRVGAYGVDAPLVIDFMVVGEYPEVLGRAGLSDLRIRPLGWRFWYGGPWLSASLVTGIRS